MNLCISTCENQKKTELKNKLFNRKTTYQGCNIVPTGWAATWDAQIRYKGAWKESHLPFRSSFLLTHTHTPWDGWVPGSQPCTGQPEGSSTLLASALSCPGSCGHYRRDLSDKRVSSLVCRCSASLINNPLKRQLSKTDKKFKMWKGPTKAFE